MERAARDGAAGGQYPAGWWALEREAPSSRASGQAGDLLAALRHLCRALASRLGWVL